MDTEKESCEKVLASVVEARGQVVDLARKIIYTHAFDHLNKWQMDVIAEALRYAREANANP